MGVIGDEGPTSTVLAFSDRVRSRGKVLLISVMPVMNTKSCSGSRYSQAESR